MNDGSARVDDDHVGGETRATAEHNAFGRNYSRSAVKHQIILPADADRIVIHGFVRTRREERGRDNARQQPLTRSRRLAALALPSDHTLRHAVSKEQTQGDDKNGQRALSLLETRRGRPAAAGAVDSARAQARKDIALELGATRAQTGLRPPLSPPLLDIDAQADLQARAEAEHEAVGALSDAAA